MMSDEFDARAYVDGNLELFDNDPPDTMYQLGYVECLKQLKKAFDSNERRQMVADQAQSGQSGHTQHPRDDETGCLSLEKLGRIGTINKSREHRLDNIEQALWFIDQRNNLRNARGFMIEHGAEEYLIETIDEALEDLGRWSDPEIEAILIVGDGISDAS